MAKEAKKRDNFSPLTVIMLVCLTAYCIALIFMLAWALSQSLKHSHLFTYDPVKIPNKESFTLDNFKAVFINMNTNWRGGTQGSPNFLGLLINTVSYSVGGAFLNAAITCLIAYLTARYNYFYSKILYGIVIVVMVVPMVGAQASEIQMLRYMHLYNTRFAFIVLKASFVGGVYFLVFYAAFKSIPMTYTEAAMIDGASDWCIMVRICLPLVLNVFMTVFLITFIQYWNDYQLPLVYMPDYPTLSYYIFMMKMSSQPIRGDGLKFPINAASEPLNLAAAMILIAPVLIIFIALHERLMGNLSVGGIKG